MKNQKIFGIAVVALLVLFVGVNLLVWECWTRKLLANVFAGGDLARMGYLPGFKDQRRNLIELPIRHIEENEYHGQPVRVLTLGDSFTNGGARGKNYFYQDYIASFNKCSVLNIEPYQTVDAFNLAIILYNNGTLDRIKPKYLLIGSSEKMCLMQYARPLNFEQKMSNKELSALKRMGYNIVPPTGTMFINQGNFKFLMNKLLYKFSDHAYFSKVYAMELNKYLFSGEHGNTVLFYRDDIRSISNANSITVSILNDNLNTLADMLSKKGIQLIFLPCIDKYNLYSDFIIDNPYPRSTFFERLRVLPKRYVMIDTKKILLKEVNGGVKDIFYADDTHWSWKASETIFRTVKFPYDWLVAA